MGVLAFFCSMGLSFVTMLLPFAAGAADDPQARVFPDLKKVRGECAQAYEKFLSMVDQRLDVFSMLEVPRSEAREITLSFEADRLRARGKTKVFFMT